MARAAGQALETSRAELVQALVDNRRARAEAEAASHAKDRFLAILSHELRTPLTPVVMALHALERSAELPALGAQHDRADPQERQGRADADRRPARRYAHLDAASSRWRAMRPTCTRSCAPPPASARPISRPSVSARPRARTRRATTSPGDAARLQQVVWNLLKNASKFTPRGGEIQIATSNADDHFVLVVADTGIGIAAEALPLIFDAFAQEGQWVTSEFGGLGLGLAIAKATVEAHHGTLVAASPGRNQGATFTMTLPLS